MLKITEIHFNHDEGSATSDAINIRRNRSEPLILAPEWREGYPPKPAAYALKALGNKVTIKARFSGGRPNTALAIRAVSVDGCPNKRRGCLLWPTSLMPGARKAGARSILGSIKESSVAFDSDGHSRIHEFELDNHLLKECGVGIHEVAWSWQFKKGKQWVDLGETNHQVYTILDMPNGPWESDISTNEIKNLHIPWTDALDLACCWAQGATTTDMAAEMITTRLNTHPSLSYIPSTMFKNYSSYEDANYQFTWFLRELQSGRSFNVNCTDCANAVTTMANLLGCDLWEGCIRSLYVGDVSYLETREILPIGRDPAVKADWDDETWGYHEIAWLHKIGYTSEVYDGCLRLDVDANYNDDIHIPIHPLKIRFGENIPGNYIFHLLKYNAYRLEKTARRRLLE